MSGARQTPRGPEACATLAPRSPIGRPGASRGAGGWPAVEITDELHESRPPVGNVTDYSPSRRAARAGSAQKFGGATRRAPIITASISAPGARPGAAKRDRMMVPERAHGSCCASSWPGATLALAQGRPARRRRSRGTRAGARESGRLPHRAQGSVHAAHLRDRVGAGVGCWAHGRPVTNAAWSPWSRGAPEVVVRAELEPGRRPSPAPSGETHRFDWEPK